MLYSPCVASPTEAGCCLGQFNNQLHLLHHALAVARALRRRSCCRRLCGWPTRRRRSRVQRLALPRLCALRRRQPVMPLEEFVARRQRQRRALAHYLYPPYLLPPTDGHSYQAAFFRRHGLRFVEPRRMSRSSRRRKR